MCVCILPIFNTRGNHSNKTFSNREKCSHMEEKSGFRIYILISLIGYGDQTSYIHLYMWWKYKYRKEKKNIHLTVNFYNVFKFLLFFQVYWFLFLISISVHTLVILQVFSSGNELFHTLCVYTSFVFFHLLGLFYSFLVWNCLYTERVLVNWSSILW